MKSDNETPKGTAGSQSSIDASTAESKSNSTVKSDYWSSPAVIGVTDFKFKSLCDFIFNTAVGCAHGCRFCYVPGISVNKQAPKLKLYGVDDPDAEWGQYVLVRPWDEKEFLRSLRAAENRPEAKLKPEGHRAVMFCSTTDPYQTIRNPDPKIAKQLNDHHRAMVHRALILIRDFSTLNVRILTRSPLGRSDFELFKSFGPRLLFGMSLPTLNDKLARIFEPHAPSVLKRLETLQAAKDFGLNIYVAVAPTYPDCDEADIRATLEAVAKLNPLTVFHEPINIRAENVERIRQQCEALGVKLNLAPFANDAAWRIYSVEQLKLVERIAEKVGLGHCLHLWPDKELPSREYLQSLEDATGFVNWLTGWWTRISEWAE